GAGGRNVDAIHDFHAFHHAAEHRISPAGGQRIQIAVVGDVDVELAVTGVRARGASEPDGTAQVLQAIAGLVGNGFLHRLGLEVGADAAALDHEARDHA